jgi:lathosterol oxidase
MTSLSHFEQLDSYLPVALNSWAVFALAVLVLSGFILVRYFAMVAIFYYLFWRKHVGVDQVHYLHDQKTRPGQVAYEIKWSVVSTLVFSVAGYLMGWLWQHGWTNIYLQLNQFGFWYLPVSLFLLSLIHEVYFYFTHVWMHRPAVYRRVHAVHHYSRKTTPWASFSFHPLEAVIQAAFLPLATLVIPLHPLAIVTYLTMMTLSAISNHLGVELISAKGVTSWFISGEHHALHHERFDCNYGLYYRFMDQVFGTDRMKEDLCKNPS